MVAQRVRVACPNCARLLRIKLKNVGREGDCRYCGHRFQARLEEVSGSGSDSFVVWAREDVREEGPGPSADAAAEIDRLTSERDRAQAECERLEQEVARLSKSAQKLPSIRARCDMLFAERAQYDREATRLQTRLTELQVALVAVEAEYEDDRARAQTEWQQWQREREIHRLVEREAGSLKRKAQKLRSLYDKTRQQRDIALAEVERLTGLVETLSDRCARLSTYLDEAEADRRASEQSRQAEIERLNSALSEALEEAESALERNNLQRDQIGLLRAALAGREQGLAVGPRS